MATGQPALAAGGEGTDRGGGAGRQARLRPKFPARPVHMRQLFRWRQDLCERAPMPAAFNPVVVTPEPRAVLPACPASAASPEPPGVIEIEFATGGRMRISGAVEAATVSALVKALSKGKRRR